MLIDKIGERFKQLRLIKNLNQIDFAKDLGISQGFLSELEKGKSSPNSQILLSVKRLFPNLNSEWLLTGEGEMFQKQKQEKQEEKGEQEEATSQGKKPSAPVPSASTAHLERRIAALERKLNTITLSPPDPSNAVEIPFYIEGVSAGTPTAFQSDLTERLTLDKSLLKRPSKCFAVRAIGDSMVGAGIENGDILIVERDRPLSNGKIVIARLHNNETTVKKLKINNGITSLIPANKKHKVIKLTPESNVVIIGTVIYIIRAM